ncbi:chromatin-modulating protein mrc1 [Chamberlinius hualienensis]
MMKVVWILLTLTLLGCNKWQVGGGTVTRLRHAIEKNLEDEFDCTDADCNEQSPQQIGTTTTAAVVSNEIRPESNCPQPPCQPITADQLLRDGFVKLGNKFYYFSPEIKSWHNALLTCQSKGAHLAHPLSSLENDHLKSYLRSNFWDTMWWLDGTDSAQEGKWVWSHDNSPITFTDWYKTEPDNSVLKSDCLLYWNVDDWKWGDGDCSVAIKYICQAHPKRCCNFSS